MRDESVVEAIRPVFESDGIWSDVDQSKSTYLLVPYMFAHIVLKDASKYEIAIDALQRIDIRLKAQNETFTWRLRSGWKIDRAEHRGIYYGEDGTIRAASEVYVELSSGSRIVPMRVAFTHQAAEDLGAVSRHAPNDYEAHRRQEVEKTRSYIELLLAAGGESAWDPLWPGQDHLTINSTGLAWILQEERRLAVG